HRNVRIGHGLRGVGGGAQAAGGHFLRDQLVEAVLADRGLAGVDLGHLVRVDVDANDGVSVLRQAGAGYATDVAEAEYRNIAHDFTGSLVERKGVGAGRLALPRSRTRESTSRQIASNWRAMGSLP